MVRVPAAKSAPISQCLGIDRPKKGELRTMKRSILFVLAALFAVCLGNVPVFGQSTGSIRGTVKDSQGGVVPNAKVTLVNSATNATADTQSNADGLFVFGYVNPANYDISVQKEGFRTTNAKVTVEVAQSLTRNFTLEVGQITESITVSDSTLSINTSNGELSHEINGKELHDLPLLNQNYYDLMKLTPGVADTGTVTGDTRGSSAMGGGGGLSVGGARTSFGSRTGCGPSSASSGGPGGGSVF
jgi:hypothetical protein